MTQTEVDAVEAPSYPAGTPVWVDLSSPNLEASKTFYGSLFGWDAFTPPDPEAGGYTMFMLNGKMVAGAGPIYNEGQPSVWSTYISTEDADATAQKVKDAGGQVVAEPMSVMTAGRMAVFQDPTGAYISIWQPGDMKGAQLVNEVGSFGWNELATPDLAKAKEFYKQVFGWDADTHDVGEGHTYTEWKLNGKSIGGAMEIGKEIPAEVPPNWLTYFIVENCDAAVAKVKELGGNVLMEPMNIQPGRFAVVTDNHGAPFAVFQGHPS